MSTAGYTDIPLEVFSGLVTDLSPSALPPGASPDCQDVIFELAGAVKTRPGLLSVFSPIVGNPAVNYLKTYTTPGFLLRMLALDSTGNLWKESSQGALSSISSGLASNAYCKSTTQFGKEYLGFSDGKFGVDIPRQFDDTNFDRVSQVGPGAAPTATDSAVTGNVSAGVHKVSVFFITRQGYWTQPSPPFTTWTAAGGKKVALTNIPTGPSNVVARVICFTAAGQNSYFFTNGQNGLPQMQIFDNSTTATTGAAGALPDFDFTDAQLQSGVSVDYLFRLVELGECAGVVEYNGRLVWWGERNKVNNFLNLTFDGGFGGNNAPLGWSLDATFGNGAGQETSNVVWGSAYRITGDGGAHGNQFNGLITQSAYQDYNSVPILRPNVKYSVRARVRYSGTVPTAGTLNIELFSAGSGGLQAPGFTVGFGQLMTTYSEVAGVIANTLTSVPMDLLFRIYTSNTLTNGTNILIDNVEVFPTNTPYNDSQLRVSRVADPESYDGLNGLMLIAPQNGQRITSCFKMRERLYIVKEHSFHATQDTGTSEPAQWSVTEISNKIGSPSINGVSLGEDWAILADRSGAYITDGGEPRKVSQEIQPTWDTLNDSSLHTLWTAIDTRSRRLYVGAPTGAATTPNKIYVLDYRGLSSAAEIADSPAVLVFFGKLITLPKSRRWVPWNVAANAGSLIERFDGTAQVYLGNGTGNGKVYQLSDAQLSDDGSSINSYYTTYFFPSHEQEQQLQLRSHRKLFPYLTTFVEGAGSLVVSAFADSLSAVTPIIPNIALLGPALRDMERPINMSCERAAFKIATNAAGSWFRLQRFVVSVTGDPWGVVRGA